MTPYGDPYLEPTEAEQQGILGWLGRTWRSDLSLLSVNVALCLLGIVAVPPACYAVASVYTGNLEDALDLTIVMLLIIEGGTALVVTVFSLMVLRRNGAVLIQIWALLTLLVGAVTGGIFLLLGLTPMVVQYLGA